MTKKDQPDLDDNNRVYPSLDGALRQIVDALDAGNDFSWYSFKRPIYGPESNEVQMEVVSYDEAGEEDEIYFVTIVVEKP